jgi:hypothetical protein
MYPFQGKLSVTPVKTAAYTAKAGEMVKVNAAGGAFTVTLPTAKGLQGRSIVIQESNNSTTAVTVATSLSQTINGASTKSLTTAYGRTTFVSDGSNWFAA